MGGVVVGLVVVLFLLAGSRDAPDDETATYEWGDELHEYSYRHPWDDD